ncbi:alpha/beta hydrolase [Sphingomonas koreensis]|nr:alpha/beta hydrolase [Sphingomonas koreensis]
MTDDVDPDIRAFLRETAAASARFAENGVHDLAARRAIAERVREPWVAGGPAMANIEERRVGASNVRVRIYRPDEGEKLPVLVYVHGGGWILFSLDTHDRLMREYAARTGMAVVGIDYSLSPEVRFPHAIGEIVEVIDWLREQGALLGLDANALAIGGDSAGANLALAANLALRDSGTPVCDALLVNYGAFDMTARPSHDRYDGDTYMLTVPEMADFWDNYLRAPTDQRDPLARPLLANLTGMPPTFLCIAECDILADENAEMADRLRAAGVAVEAHVYRGATHSFLEAVRIAPLADRALSDAAAWLRETLKLPSSGQ